MTLTSLISSLSRQNKTVKDRLTNLFVDKWSTNINYSQYFIECGISSCSYLKRGRTSFSNTIALLLSLYGGTTIILRLCSLFFINVYSKFKYEILNMNQHHENGIFQSFSLLFCCCKL